MKRSRKGVDEKILREVVAKPGSTITQVAMSLGVSKSTVSVATRRLEERGLIRRVRKGSTILLYPVVQAGLMEKADRNDRVSGGGKSVLRIGIVRAAEYPFVIGLLKELRGEGISAEIAVYDNGLEATFDLVNSRIDVALTPLPTQFIAYVLTRRLRIIGGGAYGGAGIVECNNREGEGVATTLASTMEACSIAFLGELERRRYVSSGEEGEKALCRETRYAALWEPYLSHVLATGRARLVADCGELGFSYCCTLAANTFLEHGVVGKIARLYSSVLADAKRRGVDRWLDAYSSLTGIDRAVLKKTLHRYKYNDVIDGSEAEHSLRIGGVRFPHPGLVREAVLEWA